MLAGEPCRVLLHFAVWEMESQKPGLQLIIWDTSIWKGHAKPFSFFFSFLCNLLKSNVLLSAQGQRASAGMRVWNWFRTE